MEQHRKSRLTSTSAHKNFIRKNFDTLYKQIDKPFNEQTESVKQASDHGIRNEALAIEKYQFIMSFIILSPFFNIDKDSFGYITKNFRCIK